MDPLSAIGLAGSLVSVVDLITKTTTSLYRFKKQWQATNLTVSLLIGQLTTLKAALNQISEWIATSLVRTPQHRQLVLDLEVSLESCKELILFMDRQISQLEYCKPNNLTTQSRAKLVLNDRSIKECLNHLGNQSNALNLLLTAMSCRSLSEQKHMLENRKSREVFDQVKESSSSLICLGDSNSIRSSWISTPDTSSQLNVTFDFDHELGTTKFYDGQMGSLVRRALRKHSPMVRVMKDVSFPERKHLAVRHPAKQIPASQAEIHVVKSPQKVWKANPITKNWPLHLRSVNLLLLGPSQSGKSTLLGTLKSLHRGGYDDDERESYREIIFTTIIQSMRNTLEKIQLLEIELDDEENDNHVQTMLLQPAMTKDKELLEEAAVAIAALWNDSAVKSCYQSSKEISLHCSADYYFDSIARISLPDYVPNDQDIYRCRVEHSPLQEEVFDTGKLTLHIMKYDAAGSDVKKWIHQFEDVPLIIFMADLSKYDHFSAKEPSINLMEEDIRLFSQVCNSQWHWDTNVILFLNKLDVFKGKLSTSPLKKCFPKYTGGQDCEAACAYIDRQFKSVNREKTRDIFSSCISAELDCTTLDFIMNAVQKTILRRLLITVGF